MTEGSRILLVEDDPALAREIVRALERDHWSIDHVASLGEAFEAVIQFPYRAILLDRRLPDGDGIGLIPAAKSRASPPSIIFLTAGAAAGRAKGAPGIAAARSGLQRDSRPAGGRAGPAQALYHRRRSRAPHAARGRVASRRSAGGGEREAGFAARRRPPHPPRLTDARRGAAIPLRPGALARRPCRSCKGRRREPCTDGDRVRVRPLAGGAGCISVRDRRCTCNLARHHQPCLQFDRAWRRCWADTGGRHYGPGDRRAR